MEKAKEKLDLIRLPQHFRDLADSLQRVRCEAILGTEVVEGLNKKADSIFFESCELARLFTTCMDTFENDCINALSKLDEIFEHLRCGSVAMAILKFKNLKRLAQDMVKKSDHVLKKIDNLSTMIQDAIGETCDRQGESNKIRKELECSLKQMQNEIESSRKKSATAIENWVKSEKEKNKRIKILEDKEDTGVQKLLRILKSFSVTFFKWISANAEFRDEPKEYRMMTDAIDAHHKSRKRKERAEDRVRSNETKKHRLEKSISDRDKVFDFLHEYSSSLKKLSVATFHMFTYWEFIRQCCSYVSEATKEEVKIVEEVKKVKAKEPHKSNYLEFPGLQSSLDNFKSLWQVLKDMVTMSKGDLQKSYDNLLEVYETSFSRAEAEEFRRTNY